MMWKRRVYESFSRFRAEENENDYENEERVIGTGHAVEIALATRQLPALSQAA